MSSYSIESSFISLQTYNDVVLTGHSLILLMKVFSEHFPDQSFHPTVAKGYLHAVVGFVKGKLIFACWTCSIFVAE